MNSIRTALFVPGSRSERFAKAIACGADRVIVDFEDAVEPGLKAQARDNLADYLHAADFSNVMVRINAQDTQYHAEDIRFCREHPQLKGVVIPKAESAAQLESVSSLGLSVWPLIESAQGLIGCSAIAAAAGVERLTFGALDLGYSLGVDPSDPAINLIFDQVRYSLLISSAANNLAAPLDTIFPNVENTEGLVAFARHGKSMGMGGMLCIHPRQIAIIDQVHQHQEAEVLWARRLIDFAAGQPGAFRFEGRMIDAPVLEKARRLLSECL